jgi:catechol 2,3-dioxygenase-like lactoylglutathione lyase family enzyme
LSERGGWTVKVEGLGWLGIRTERFEETARFFREVMGLEETRRERDVVGFAFPDGAEMEVWRPEDEFHSFSAPGPSWAFGWTT